MAQTTGCILKQLFKQNKSLSTSVVVSALLAVHFMLPLSAFAQRSVTMDAIRRQSQVAMVQQAVYQLMAESRDLDSDGTFEAPGMRLVAGRGPTDGGLIPDSSGAPKTDGFGSVLGYCSWDSGSVTNSANHLPGGNTAAATAMAVISFGVDNTYQTTCANVAAGITNGDDYVFRVTLNQLTSLSSNAVSTYWGAPVANAAALNDLTPSALREGEVRLTRDDNSFWRWNAGTSTWTKIGGSNWGVSGPDSVTTGKVAIGQSNVGAEQLVVNAGAGMAVGLKGTGALNGVQTYDTAGSVATAFFGYDNTNSRLNLEAYSGSVAIRTGGQNRLLVGADGVISLGSGQIFDASRNLTAANGTFSGYVNAQGAGYQVGGVTVIDASRNLLNMLNITASGVADVGSLNIGGSQVIDSSRVGYLSGLSVSGASTFSGQINAAGITASGAIVAASGITLSGGGLVLNSATVMGPLASIPAPATAGRIYITTDANKNAIFRDTGSAWVEVASRAGLFEADAGSNIVSSNSGWAGVVGDHTLGHAFTGAIRNIFVGHGSGAGAGQTKIDFGYPWSQDNVTLGYGALSKTLGTSYNVAIGSFAMENLNSDSSDLWTNGGSIAVGYKALTTATVAGDTIAIGKGALGLQRKGYKNIAIGSRSMGYSENDNYTVNVLNVAVGDSALASAISGRNVALGASALAGVYNGSLNTAIGTGAGYSKNVDSYGYAQVDPNGTIGGSNNTFLGAYSIGRPNINFATAVGAGSEVSTSNTVVLGRTSDKVAIGQTGAHVSYKFVVNGPAGGTTAWNSVSDVRYKKDITRIESALGLLQKIEGVRYLFNSSAFPEKNFESGIQMGFIAQQIEPYVPEIVHTDALGFKSVQYSQITPLLVEGVKELGVSLGGKLDAATGRWIKSSDSVDRLFFEGSGRTVFKAVGLNPFEFRGEAGSLLASISSTGEFNAPGGVRVGSSESSYQLVSDAAGNLKLVSSQAGARVVLQSKDAVLGALAASGSGLDLQTADGKTALRARTGANGAEVFVPGQLVLGSDNSASKIQFSNGASLGVNAAGLLNLSLKGSLNISKEMGGDVLFGFDPEGVLTVSEKVKSKALQLIGSNTDAAAAEGTLAYRNDLKKLRFFDGSRWIDLNGAGQLDEQGNFVTSVLSDIRSSRNSTFLGQGSSAGADGLSYATAIGAGSRVMTSNTIVLGRTTDKVVIGSLGDDGSANALQVTGGVRVAGDLTVTGATTLGTTRLTGGLTMANLAQAGADCTESGALARDVNNDIFVCK